MAIETVSSIHTSGNSAVPTTPAIFTPVTREKLARVKTVAISTATLPGLIQRYCEAEDALSSFYPQPE